jgi:hypothetical protein
MSTKDSFDPAYPLPQFLAEPQFLADQAEQDIGNAPDGAVTASRLFKASILIAAAAATGIAVLAAGNPVALFADMSASLIDNSSPQSMPTIQSAADAPALIAATADVQVLPPTTTDAPARDEIAASEPAGKDQTEKSESPSETLFRQFQSWAAEQDAQAHGGPAQPVQDEPAQIVQNVVPAPAAENVRVTHRLAQKRRQVRATHNARAEMRAQNLRKEVRRAQSARTERPPVRDARAQDPSVQNTQASFLPIFGLRN